MMDYNNPDYQNYINSQEWREKRALVLERSGEFCERCDRCVGYRNLEVHHLTYKNFGNERLEDLLALCRKCHNKADKERKIQNGSRLWEARVRGWARKVLGPNYDYRYAEIEFKAWLRRRGRS